MTFSDDKIKCLAAVTDRYFAEAAVSICANITFADDKIKCLNTIADKTYANQAVDVCKSLSFADDQVKCLQTAGSPVVDCINLSEIELVLYRSLKELRRADYQGAATKLQYLLDRIQACPNR